MEITVEKQAKNAIKWIDELPNYKQAPRHERGRLGDSEAGYCCLGAGCVITGIPFIAHSVESSKFKDVVGLLDTQGVFHLHDQRYYNRNCLADINDITNAGFKRISKLLKTHPDWMFIPEVATLIKQHYSN